MKCRSQECVTFLQDDGWFSCRTGSVPFFTVSKVGLYQSWYALASWWFITAISSIQAYLYMLWLQCTKLWPELVQLSPKLFSLTRASPAISQVVFADNSNDKTLTLYCEQLLLFQVGSSPGSSGCSCWSMHLPNNCHRCWENK